MIGERFNKLKVLELDFKRCGKKYYKCLCDCGNVKTIQGDNIKSGHTKSCGCYRKEKSKEIMTKHGMCRTRIYAIWTSMIRRCHKKTSSHFRLYGGRGIKVCKKWHDFNLFYEDMKEGYNDTLTIERIDSNKNYNKENCKWATSIEQNNNTSRNRIISFNDKTDTVANMCRFYNLPYQTISLRLNQLKWSVEKAFLTPIMKRGKKNEST